MNPLFPHFSLRRSLWLPIVGFGLLMPTLANARHISPQEALSRVKAETGKSLSKSEAEVVRRIANQTRSASAPAATIGSLYVYSADDSYIIIPAEDNAPALLAYSDNSPFSSEAEMNPELRYWLEFYNSELASLATSEGAASETRASERPQRAAIAPLTKTTWNQEAPYNELCPKVNGRGNVTGCVATAMVQVLKFYS